MRMLTQTLPLVAAALLLLAAHPTDARRVRVRPAQRTPVATEDDASAPASAAADQETNPQQIRYYAAQPSDTDDAQQGGVVLVSSDPYNGLYGRPTARTQTDVSEAQLRSALASSRAYSAAAQQQAAARPRVKETAKQPPVQTIRNYSKVNDDGSFTFGYEAADGSFKEETRGTDCVVRGKYGYIDPDGNKREFTYVSGNPCDPNAVQEDEEEQREAPDSGEENIPKQPLRPLRPLRPTAAPATVAPRPTTTVFEQNYQAGDDVEDTLDDAPQHLFTPTPRTRYVQPAPTPSPTPGYSSYVSTGAAGQAVRITPRPPLAAATTPRSQLPATTYRPQLLQLAVTPRPGVVYTKTPVPARPTVASAPQPTYVGSSTPTIDFDEELRKFQLENNVLTTPAPARAQAPQPTPRPVHAQPVRAQIPQQQYQPQQQQYYQQQQQPQQQRKVPSGDPIYTSELVYDPATGQYNTVLYQQLPQTTGELNLRHRLQPYVHQPLLQQPSQQSQQQPQSQYYQQQQAALLAQSQQLYAQQQQQRAIAQQQQRYIQQQQQLTTQPTTRAPQRYTPTQLQAQPQHPQSQAQYYFVTPSANAAQGNPLAQGQIEAFLRGHNIAF